jgi:hypothetical protein
MVGSPSSQLEAQAWPFVQRAISLSLDMGLTTILRSSTEIRASAESLFLGKFGRLGDVLGHAADVWGSKTLKFKTSPASPTSRCRLRWSGDSRAARRARRHGRSQRCNLLNFMKKSAIRLSPFVLCTDHVYGLTIPQGFRRRFVRGRSRPTTVNPISRSEPTISACTNHRQ